MVCFRQNFFSPAYNTGAAQTSRLYISDIGAISLYSGSCAVCHPIIASSASFDENESDFLLPIITGKVADNLTNYRNQAGRINKGLKAIAKKACIAAPLTMYVARHTWATIAKSQGVPIGVISEGLGHDSERTTMIYLAALESSAIDNANRKIIKALE